MITLTENVQTHWIDVLGWSSWASRNGCNTICGHSTVLYVLEDGGRATTITDGVITEEPVTVT